LFKDTILRAIRKTLATEYLARSREIQDLRNEQIKGNSLAAKHLIWALQTRGILPCLKDAEFRVSSQFGDDGIIQYLLHHLRMDTDTFIDFGVENYRESNTRFLLENNNWRGLVIDGSQANIDFIRSEDIYWRHDLTAVCSFITAENINQIFEEHGFTGEIGILSIDIDGNDWHV
jgi:hypothetical protein